MKRVPVWAWVLWAALGFLLEGIAIGTIERGDTLTEVLMTLPIVVGTLALGWVTWHFGIRLWRRLRP